MADATHPNVIHVDDVEESQIAKGHLAYGRRRLAAAGGAQLIGASRYVVPPGAVMMPAHTHSDEEEIAYVLAGGGLLWLDGRTYEVTAGDCVVFPIQGPAHTLIAGDVGLTVLVFGEGSLTNITYLPRSKSWWLGSRWLPAEGPNPFKLEIDLGPLELPAEPEAERPPTVVSLIEAPLEVEVRPGYDIAERDLARAAGSVRSGLRHDILGPGTLSCPPHWHTTEEELFYVLDGDGEVVLGEDRHPLRPGSVVVRPPNSKVAHSLRAGAGGLTYLAYGTRVPSDVCFYPRSGKANIGGMTFRLEATDYWEGEEERQA
jgi:uncharacterized cupin superfamily protein